MSVDRCLQRLLRRSAKNVSGNFPSVETRSDLCSRHPGVRPGTAAQSTLGAFIRSRTSGGGDRAMTFNWISGNAISLLENGDEFFPSIIAAIDGAQKEILLETFILCDDPVG